MKIKFLGVGSAFTTPEYYQSNMLVTAANGKKMLFDCGSDIRFSLGDAGISAMDLCDRIDAVYISHLHADHIGGLEWLAINVYFNPSPAKPMLFAEGKTMQCLWESSLKGGLLCMGEGDRELSDYFRCRPLRENDSFTWSDITFTLVKMPHITTCDTRHDSYGLIMEEKGSQTVFLTSDAMFAPDILAEVTQKTDIIFHDCETSPFKTGVHAHYSDLCTLDPDLKRKMWLYHYHPNSTQNPEKDGFKGFVEKGREFDL